VICALGACVFPEPVELVSGQQNDFEFSAAVISTGPRNAASTISPDLLPRSVNMEDGILIFQLIQGI
jgi:hypothetical protein